MNKKRIVNIVLDIGKTNTKIFLFNTNSKIIKTYFKNFQSKKINKHVSILDTENIWVWLNKKINLILKKYGIGKLIPICHGSAIAFISNKDELLHGIIDYESNLGNLNSSYKKILPPFYETYTPLLDGGLNLGKQIFFLYKKKKEIINNTKYILNYPQYWNWKLCGKYSSEISYIGCHSHLWNFKKNTYSSLLKKMKIEKKFPKFNKAGKDLKNSFFSPKTRILNGMHDTNASYILYKKLFFNKFTLISTGTWFVIINNSAKKNSLKSNKDMLANIDIYGKILPTIRLMGGREFEILCKKFKVSRNFNLTLNKSSFSNVYSNLILPSFAMAGPFSEKKGIIKDFSKLSKKNKYLHICLYISFMINYCLDLIFSKNNIIIDGALIKNKVILQILSTLRKKQNIYINSEKYGPAIGASQFFNSNKKKTFTLNKIKKFHISNIDLYYKKWLDRVKN